MQNNNNNDVMFEAFASYGTKEWNESHYSVQKSAFDKKIKTKYEIIEAEEVDRKEVDNGKTIKAIAKRI